MESGMIKPEDRVAYLGGSFGEKGGQPISTLMRHGRFFKLQRIIICPILQHGNKKIQMSEINRTIVLMNRCA